MEYDSFKVGTHNLRSYGKGKRDAICANAVLLGKEYGGPSGKLKDMWSGPTKGDNWLDLGANIGSASLWFLDNGANSVLAVEPDKSNARSYRHNLRKYSNAEIVEAALVPRSLGEDIVTLYLSKGKTTSHQVRDIPIRGREFYEVKTVTIEELIKQQTDSGSPVTAIKMDAEGVEMQIVKELHTHYWKGVEKACIEYHFGINKAMQDYHDVIDRLKKLFKHVELSSPLPKGIEDKERWTVYPDLRIIYAWK